MTQASEPRSACYKTYNSKASAASGNEKAVPPNIAG
jgi:hypothetical protein